MGRLGNCFLMWQAMTSTSILAGLYSSRTAVTDAFFSCGAHESQPPQGQENERG